MKETTVTEASSDDFATLLEDYMDVVLPEHGAVLLGTVIGSRSDGILVDLGLKREGLVPIADIERAGKGLNEFTAGDNIEVLVIEKGHGTKHTILSISQAQQHQAWLDAEALMGSGEIFTGTVQSSNRGGIIVTYQGLPGFVPASHVVGISRSMSEDERRNELEQTVGQEMALRVIEVDRTRHRLVLSQRAAQRASREKQKEELLAELREGQVLHGKISSVREFGAFVDLGTADGLVHVSELAWRQVEHPSHAVKPGDEVDVMVIKIDRQRKRIGLSIKQLLPSPWDSAEEWIVPGQTLPGRVTRVLHFGAFVELKNGIEGLLHKSEFPDEENLEIAPGDEITVRVVSVDTERQRVALSVQNLDGEQNESAMTEPTIQDDTEDTVTPSTPEENDDIDTEFVADIIDEDDGKDTHEKGGD